MVLFFFLLFFEKFENCMTNIFSIHLCMKLYDNDFCCMELYDKHFQCMEVNPGEEDPRETPFVHMV